MAELFPAWCPKCRHPWRSHENTGWPTEKDPDPQDECSVNMGMGDWCACKEKRPEGWDPVEDFVSQVEAGTRMVHPVSGEIQGYVVYTRDWQGLIFQLRKEVKRRG